MGNFISNLIARHTTATSYVLPRQRGRFEPQPGPAAETGPAYFRPGVSPSADDTPAPADVLPEQPDPVRASVLRAATPVEEREQPPTVPPVNSTVAPPETILSLFRPLVTAPAAKLPADSGREQAMADNYPDTTPIGGTVNNLFVNHPPPEKGGANTPATPPEQTQHSTVRSLYFTVNPPGQQGVILPAGNGNRPAVSPNMQRSGQHAAAAAAPQQVIKVSIGRIDVRALPQPAAAKTNTGAKAAMSLDDFLKKRSGGTS